MQERTCPSHSSLIRKRIWSVGIPNANRAELLMCLRPSREQLTGQHPPEEVKRVLLFCPPRVLSTALERAIIECPDVHVLHEPFGSPFYWGKDAVCPAQGELPPGKTATTFGNVLEQVLHDPLPPGKRFLFTKNLSYYVSHRLPELFAAVEGDWSRVRCSFMIRHPARAIGSLYIKSCVDNAQTGYTRFEPAECGFTDMVELYRLLEQQPGANAPIIVDADDFLDNPEGILAAYCSAVSLPFSPSMLSWEPGPVPELTASPFSGWTTDVMQSSGVHRRDPSRRNPPPALDSFPPEVQAKIEEAMPIYEYFYSRRLRAVGMSPTSVRAHLPHGHDAPATAPTAEEVELRK